MVELHRHRVLKHILPCRRDVLVDKIVRDPLAAHQREIIVHQTSLCQQQDTTSSSQAM